MCAYNPANPREALIVRDWNRRDARALLPLVLIAFGIGVIARGRRVGREALDPAGQLRHRNAAGWDVARTPQGFRCVPKPERGLSVAKLTDMVKGQPFTAIELIDYPLRGNGPNRMRIERPPAAEPRGITVHLELIGRFRQTKRAAPILVSSGREPPDHVFEFDLPDDEAFLDPDADLRLRFTPGAGLFPSAARFLWVQIEHYADPTRMAEAR
jgi:hypothetical protein